MAKKQPQSVLQSIHDDYGLMAQEQDPKKVADTLDRLSAGIKSGEIGILGFTYGFTNTVGDLPRAVIDLDFMEHKVIQDRRADAPEAE